MSASIYIAILLVGYLSSFFFSGFETGAYSMSALRFRLLEAEQDSRARIMARHLGGMPRLIATTLVGTNLGNYLLTFGVVGLLAGYDPQTRELLSLLILTPFVFVAAEILPKELYRAHADVLVYKGARAFDLSDRLFAPISILLNAVTDQLRRLVGVSDEHHGASVSLLERLSIELTQGTEEGQLSTTQATIAQRVMGLEHRRVANVTVPLNRVTKLNLKQDLVRAREVFVRTGYSRVPVFRSQPRSLMGFVSLYDVLFGAHQDLEACVKPLLELPASDGIEQGLLKLRAARAAMAAVTGRGGRIIGIVTLKDLATEIVADLHEL